MFRTASKVFTGEARCKYLQLARLIAAKNECFILAYPQKDISDRSCNPSFDYKFSSIIPSHF